jgi:hypothetical protein
LKYHPDDIAPIDTWEYLGRNEGRFFRSGSFDAVELAGMIATEALVKGAESVHIVSGEEDWLTVTADSDWLGDQERDAFRGLTPFPESGANGILAEVLATAYSRGVATASPQGVEVVKGDSAPAACRTGRGVARAVSFRRRRADGGAAGV